MYNKKHTRYQWLTTCGYSTCIYNRVINIYTGVQRLNIFHQQMPCTGQSIYLTKTLVKITRSLCWTNKKDKMELVAWTHAVN